jgi:hypothetical protein
MRILEYTLLVAAGSLMIVAAMSVFEGHAYARNKSEVAAPAWTQSPPVISPRGSQPNDKWYEVGGVGFHILDDHIPAEKLSDAQALLYFAEGAPHLSELWRVPENRDRVAKSLQALQKSLRYFNLAKNPAPFAEVARFSSKRVVIRALYPLGAYLWHHYFETLAVYELERNGRIDERFKLVELEKKLSFTFKGIGHGTRAGYFSNPDNADDTVTKVLGRPDDEYMSQTLSYRLIYYRRYNISIEIHDGVVYTVEQGKPGWVGDE